MYKAYPRQQPTRTEMSRFRMTHKFHFQCHMWIYYYPTLFSEKFGEYYISLFVIILCKTRYHKVINKYDLEKKSYKSENDLIAILQLFKAILMF